MTSTTGTAGAQQSDPAEALADAVTNLVMQQAVAEAFPADPTATRDHASAMYRLAEQFLDIGAPKAARPHAEGCLSLTRGRLAEAPTDPATISDMIASLRQCAQAAAMSDDLKTALEHLDEAIGIVRASIAAGEGHGTTDLPMLLMLHAYVDAELGDHRAALQRLNEGLDAYELHGADNNHESATGVRRMLLARMAGAAMQLDTLAAKLDLPGDAATAIELHTEALAAFRRIIEFDPTDARSASALWVCLTYLGRAHRVSGDLDTARGFHDEALLLADRLTGVEAVRDQALRSSAMSLDNLAEIELAQGDPQPAHDLRSEALGIFRYQVQQAPDDLGALRGMAVELVALGDSDMALGRPGNAQYAYFEASGHFRRLAKRDAGNSQHARDLVGCLVRWVDAIAELGDQEGTGDLLLEAREVAEGLLGTDEAWARGVLTDLDARIALLNLAEAQL